jgi:hypothetical protein
MVEARIYFSQQNGNTAVVHAEQENPAAPAENGHQS